MRDAPEPAPPEEACANCGATLAGAYCSRCGQEKRSLDRSLGAFLLELVDGILNFDSRAWRTLVPLLFRPGEVTARYLEGQRARFVPPVRLYLFVSLLYFLMLVWLAPGADVDIPPEVEGAGDAPWETLADLPFVSALVPGAERAAADPEAFRRDVVQGISYLMFFLVPLFGAMVQLLHRRRGRYYVHHLLFAVHFHVVVFIVLGLTFLLERTGLGFLEDAGELLHLAIPLHLFLGLRRVYGGRLWLVLVRAFLLGTGYLLALSLSLAVLVIVLLA